MKTRFKSYMRTKNYQSKSGSTNSSGKNSKLPKEQKGNRFEEFKSKNKLFYSKLSQINPKNRDMLKEVLEEESRRNNFIRIYPSRNSDIYDQFFISPKISNKIVYKYLFTNEIVPVELPKGFTNSLYNKQVSSKNSSMEIDPNQRQLKELKMRKMPKNLPQDGSGKDVGGLASNQSSASTSSTIQKDGGTTKLPQVNLKRQTYVNTDKLLITGDDVLIEYVARLMIAVKSIKENMLK